VRAAKGRSVTVGPKPTGYASPIFVLVFASFSSLLWPFRWLKKEGNVVNLKVKERERN